jgi:hypothetical protein
MRESLLLVGSFLCYLIDSEKYEENSIAKTAFEVDRPRGGIATFTPVAH